MTYLREYDNIFPTSLSHTLSTEADILGLTSLNGLIVRLALFNPLTFFKLMLVLSPNLTDFLTLLNNCS